MIEKILTHLEGVRDNGNGKYLARCPSHKDKSPSLALKEVDDRVLIKCWAGCDTESVLAALGLTFADLFPEKIPTSYTGRQQQPKHPHFNKSQLFDLLLGESMILAIGVNSMAGNPLDKAMFNKESFTNADFKRVLRAMHTVVNTYMEIKSK